MDRLQAFEVERDRQDRGEQHQHRQRSYHSPDYAMGSPLLPDILAFNFFLGQLADGRRQRGDLIPEPGVAQGQAPIAAGPGHIEIVGLGWEDTAQRMVPSGGGRTEITAVMVPNPRAISNHDQQMICALARCPMGDLLADPVRPGGLRGSQQHKPTRGVKRGPDTGPQPGADRQAGLVPEHLHRAAAVPRPAQLLQAPLQGRGEHLIGLVGIRDKGVIGFARAFLPRRAIGGIRTCDV